LVFYFRIPKNNKVRMEGWKDGTASHIDDRKGYVI